MNDYGKVRITKVGHGYILEAGNPGLPARREVWESPFDAVSRMLVMMEFDEDIVISLARGTRVAGDGFDRAYGQEVD